MAIIRPLAEEDLRSVAGLHRRVFDQHVSSDDLPLREAYLRRVFFESTDGVISSKVCEERGRVVGFLGVVPREMLFMGKPVLAAISSQFIVEPESRCRMIGLQMLKEYLQGPQELSIADEANNSARVVWEALGGATASLYSFYWTRLLRPSQYALSLIRHRKGWTPLVIAARPISRLLDAIAIHIPRNPLRRPRSTEMTEDTNGERFLSDMSEFYAGHKLRPVYDLSLWKSVLERAQGRRDCGVFYRVVVKNRHHETVGSYLYYLNHDGTSEVLQITANPKSERIVLHHLLHHAWQGGALAVSGRLQPGWMQVLAENGCVFYKGPWVLVHSKKRPDLLQEFYEGNAFFSRTEGEWCLRYR